MTDKSTLADYKCPCAVCSGSAPEVLICDQCGEETDDDYSTVWESAWHNSGELSRVCYDCAPPDEE